ncbi:hypothetical protein K438DRAFT_1842629 [Mycena galopus ATCC 62051]|nr:hypothetical protein K438DRAFT_1842629 [Mycena galopus ATCC 62051]
MPMASSSFVVAPPLRAIVLSILAWSTLWHCTRPRLSFHALRVNCCTTGFTPCSAHHQLHHVFRLVPSYHTHRLALALVALRSVRCAPCASTPTSFIFRALCPQSHHALRSVFCEPPAAHPSSRTLRALSHHAHHIALVLCAALASCSSFVLCTLAITSCSLLRALRATVASRSPSCALSALSLYPYHFALVLCAHRLIELIASPSCSARTVAACSSLRPSCSAHTVASSPSHRSRDLRRLSHHARLSSFLHYLSPHAPLLRALRATVASRLSPYDLPVWHRVWRPFTSWSFGLSHSLRSCEVFTTSHVLLPIPIVSRLSFPRRSSSYCLLTSPRCRSLSTFSGP